MADRRLISAAHIGSGLRAHQRTDHQHHHTVTTTATASNHRIHSR